MKQSNSQEALRAPRGTLLMPIVRVDQKQAKERLGMRRKYAELALWFIFLSQAQGGRVHRSGWHLALPSR